MSQVIVPGVVPVSSWQYMARCMAEDMTNIGDGIFTETKDLRPGVVADAIRFFGSVMEELCLRGFHRIPQNPPASITDYGYAMKALPHGTQEELAELAIFVGRLAYPHEFRCFERRIAMDAAVFFKALAALTGLE